MSRFKNWLFPPVSANELVRRDMRSMLPGMLIEQVAATLLDNINIVVMGFIGSEATAGVSQVSTINNTMMIVVQFFAMGGTALVAQAAGAEGAAVSALLLAMGIGIQNFPEGMCVAFPLRQKGLSPLRSFLFSQGSGAVEIPACVLGAIAAATIAGLMPWALAFSAGAMIAVVCSELIPECFSGNKTVASAGVVLGFCLMMVLDVALG